MSEDINISNHHSEPVIPATGRQALKTDFDGRTLTDVDIDRIIEMAWEDRTTFDAIYVQFGLKENDVKALMKRSLKFSSYTLWRKRVEACKTKHSKTRVADITRFKSKLQRAITSNKISKRRFK